MHVAEMPFVCVFLFSFFNHTQSGVVYNFGRVCLSVCHTKALT